MCRVELIYDDAGAWRLEWACGESAYGVSDYDLAIAKSAHECKEN